MGSHSVICHPTEVTAPADYLKTVRYIPANEVNLAFHHFGVDK